MEDQEGYLTWAAGIRQKPRRTEYGHEIFSEAASDCVRRRRDRREQEDIINGDVSNETEIVDGISQSAAII